MYNGEVHIGQEQLGDFLKAAQMLQVRGLADVPTPGVPMNNLDHKISPVIIILFHILYLIWRFSYNYFV